MKVKFNFFSFKWKRGIGKILSFDSNVFHKPNLRDVGGVGWGVVGVGACVRAREGVLAQPISASCRVFRDMGRATSASNPIVIAVGSVLLFSARCFSR